jgi:hypothetical protein
LPTKQSVSSNAEGHCWRDRPSPAFFGLPGPFAFNLPVAQTAAENIWEQTALGWEDRQDELRAYFRRGMIASGQAAGGGADLPVKAPPRAAPEAITPGVWVKTIVSGTDRKDIDNFAQAFGNPLLAGLNWDNSYRQTTYAVIGGFDFGRAELTSPRDSLVFGVMGGYISSAVGFNSPNVFFGPATSTRFNYSGGTVGVSADYMNGGFFIDALVKADFLDLDISGIPGGFLGAGVLSGDQTVHSRTWGVLSNVGYRFELGRYFVEPLGTLSWAQSKIGDLALPGAGVNVDFGTGEALNLAGGVRAGGVLMDDRVHYLETSVTAKVWDRVSGDNTVNFASVPALPGTAFSLTDNKLGNPYGEVSLQLDWIDRQSGWSTFVRGDAFFNDQFTTLTGKGGIRYGF